LAKKLSAADMEHAIRGIKLPANKDHLVSQAKKNKASKDTIQAIKDLPKTEFKTAIDISKAFGEERRIIKTGSGRMISAADVEHAIKGIKFPANRNDLIHQAKNNKEEPEVVQILKDLPENKFNTAVDVSKAFGEEKRS